MGFPLNNLTMLNAPLTHHEQTSLARNIKNYLWIKEKEFTKIQDIFDNLQFLNNPRPFLREWRAKMGPSKECLECESIEGRALFYFEDNFKLFDSKDSTDNEEEENPIQDSKDDNVPNGGVFAMEPY
jgi:hypothetical protein